jgi:hypothetical protein
MTNEERDIISRFIERVGGSQAAPFGSVPGTTPALPPVDPEADRLIGDLFAQNPAARYRITQTAFVQEHALAEAQNRIRRLEWELAQAKQAAAAAPPPPPPQSRGFLGGIFGGGASAPQQPPPVYAQPQYQAAPPPPQYAPGYQPGMFQRSGSGFLGSALTTAAGVAGGLVVGNALMDMFSPHHEMGGGLMGGGMGENIGGFGGGGVPVESPWGNAAGNTDIGGGGGGVWDNQAESGDSGSGFFGGGGGGGWDDSSGGGGGGGGWDDSSGGGGDSGGWDNS